MLQPRSVPSPSPSLLRSISTYRGPTRADPPFFCFGLPRIDPYHPLTEFQLPPDERVARFQTWVSSYYTHSPAALAAHDPLLLDTTPLPSPAPPADRPATLDRMSAAERAGVAWPGPIGGSEQSLYLMPPPICAEQVRRALFDEGAARVLPRCKVVVVWGSRTLWDAVGAAWTVERMVEERRAAGEKGRRVEVVEMPGANHFVRFCFLTGLWLEY